MVTMVTIGSVEVLRGGTVATMATMVPMVTMVTPQGLYKQRPVESEITDLLYLHSDPHQLQQTPCLQRSRLFSH